MISYEFRSVLRKALYGESEEAHQILGMLRGPDYYLPNGTNDNVVMLKEYTVERIRYFIYVLPKDARVLIRTARLNDKEREARDEMLKHAPSHFTYHYNGAVNAIRTLYGYDLINEEDLKVEEDK